MDQQPQVNNITATPGIPLKRRRGRPRKDPTLLPTRRASFPLSNKDQTQNNGENAPIPPGFEQTNGTQQHTTSTVDNGNNEDAMVGKVVTGVIEASFEAGYLLSVRVGESETSLRGIVFKPGHFVPVSSENDVAPTLQMIRRNEVPIPSVDPVKKRRGRKRSEHHHHSNSAPPCNQATQLSIVPFQPSHSLGSRGTLVPVVLQPINVSNGATTPVEAPPIASKPAHLAAGRPKPVPLSRATEVTDSGSGSQPLSELVCAAKRMRGSPESVETRCENGISEVKNMSKDCGVSEENVEDLSKPLMVKPLQAIRSGSKEESGSSLSHAFSERRTGKMTELLLAVQENLRERQMSENHQEFKSPEN